jgi:hypothetical protein
MSHWITHYQYHCTIANIKVFESRVKSSQADFLYSSVLLPLLFCTPPPYCLLSLCRLTLHYWAALNDNLHSWIICNSLVFSVRLIVSQLRLESLDPNSQLCVSLYSHSLEALVSSNWFPCIDAARTSVTENTCHVIATHCVVWRHFTCARCRDTKKTLLLYCWPCVCVCCELCLTMSLHVTIYCVVSI